MTMARTEPVLSALVLHVACNQAERHMDDAIEAYTQARALAHAAQAVLSPGERVELKQLLDALGPQPAAPVSGDAGDPVELARAGARSRPHLAVVPRPLRGTVA